MNVNVQRSLQPLRIRYADPLLGRLRSFWRWWSGELVELLPENLQKAIAQRQQKLYVEIEDDKFLLSLGNRAAQREILRLAIDAADAEDEDIPREVQQTLLLLPQPPRKTCAKSSASRWTCTHRSKLPRFTTTTRWSGATVHGSRSPWTSSTRRKMQSMHSSTAPRRWA
jgi:hypothetical protein